MRNYKNIIFAGLLTLSCLTTTAQSLQPKVLSDDHVMLRVATDKKYVLLPVEESQENSHIRVIKDNQCIQELNVRLAVNKVDYYVPLSILSFSNHKSQISNLKPQILLDIYVNRGDAANSASKAATQDFTAWKEIKTSDTFDISNHEKFRPAYHHTPAYGWMNDPNGMFYKDGVWNLYYQHNPYGSQWENMTWGHSTSTDLVHWKFEGEAIEPDALGTIFSGCAVVDKDNTAGYGNNAIIAYYTAAGKAQKQCMAVSTDDGKTFTKYEDNPVLVSNIPDFRDPHIIWYGPDKKWILIVSEKQHMKLYSSKNLRDWTWESDFGEGYGSHEGVWECPDLIEVGNRWILVCNINPGGPFGGSATQYFTGAFDGHKFTCDTEPTVTKWMDWGKDHYATVTFANAPDGRHVALPWMSNWQYANQVPTKQYRAANGIPRDLGYFEYKGTGYVSVKPSAEVLSAFSSKAQKSLTPACRVDVQLRDKATIVLSNSKGEQVTMTYDAANENFTMDRTKSGDTSFSNDFAAVTKAPSFGKIKTLQLFIDKSSIEAFDADGKMAMTNIVFPSEPYNKMTVKGGKAKIYVLK